MKLSRTLQHEIEVTLEYSGYFEKHNALPQHNNCFSQTLNTSVQCINLYNAVSEQQFEYLHLKSIIPFFKRHHPFVFPTAMTPDDTLFCGAQGQKKQEKVIDHYFENCLFPDQATGFNAIERIQSLRTDLNFSALATFGARRLMQANLDVLAPSQLQTLADELTLDQLQAIESSDEPEQMCIIQLVLLRSKIQNVIDQFFMHYKSTLIKHIRNFHEFIRLYRSCVNGNIDRYIKVGLQQVINDISTPLIQLPTQSRCSRLNRFYFRRHHQQQLTHTVQRFQRAHIDNCSVKVKIDLINALTEQPQKLRRILQQSPSLVQQFLKSSSPEQAETKNESDQNDSQQTQTPLPSTVNLYL